MYAFVFFSHFPSLWLVSYYFTLFVKFIYLLTLCVYAYVGSRDEIQVVMLPLPTERTILLALAFLFFKNNFSKSRSFMFWIAYYFFRFFKKNVYDISLLRIFPQPKFLYKYLDSLHKFYSSCIHVSVYCPLEVDFYAWVKVLFLFYKIGFCFVQLSNHYLLEKITFCLLN